MKTLWHVLGHLSEQMQALFFFKLSGSAGSAAIKMSPLQFQVPTKIFLKGVKVAAMRCSRCVYLCRPPRWEELERAPLISVFFHSTLNELLAGG